MWKWETNAEDQEDFEQEKEIKGWLLSQERRPDDFDFRHISRKGTARNTLIKASISLDQQICEDSSGTFADIIAGSDGRDLYVGEGPGTDQIIDAYFYCLGFDEETSEWLVKILKLSMNLNNMHSLIFPIDLEW